MGERYVVTPRGGSAVTACGRTWPAGGVEVEIGEVRLNTIDVGTLQLLDGDPRFSVRAAEDKPPAGGRQRRKG